MGVRYDDVLTAIEEKTAQASGHVGHLERYNTQLDKVIEGMVGAGSNEPPEKKADGPAVNGNGIDAEKTA